MLVGWLTRRCALPCRPSSLRLLRCLSGDHYSKGSSTTGDGWAWPPPRKGRGPFWLTLQHLTQTYLMPGGRPLLHVRPGPGLPSPHPRRTQKVDSLSLPSSPARFAPPAQSPSRLCSVWLGLAPPAQLGSAQCGRSLQRMPSRFSSMCVFNACPSRLSISSARCG